MGNQFCIRKRSKDSQVAKHQQKVENNLGTHNRFGSYKNILQEKKNQSLMIMIKSSPNLAKLQLAQQAKFQQELCTDFRNFQTESMKREREFQEQLKRQYLRQDEQVRKRMKQRKQKDKKQEYQLMQRLKAEDRRARAKMNNQQPEDDKFNKQCQICLAQITLANTGLLSCGHMFHAQCINSHINTSIQTNIPQIKCPMDDCGKKINEQDIRQFTDQALLRKFQQMSFRKFVQMNSAQVSWCPTANCPAVYVFDEHIQIFICPVCKNSYCLKCKCQFHINMTCAEFKISNTYSQNDRKFQKFVKGAKYKQCPSCKFWVAKTQGCDHMTCICKFQFCYRCGRTYPSLCKAKC